ncbi:MAG: PadR family transcriptional regulator [Actinomycetota bacterium]
MKQPGMLELPVLGLLKERSMHGYELRKQLGAMLGPFWQVSWGSLYPTLRRLAKSGAVEKLDPKPDKATRTRAKGARALAGKAKAATTTRAARNTTTLPSGRRKNVYRVTPLGEEMFTAMLEETAAAVDAEHFTLKLAFFRYLPPETRLALLERRRAYLQDKLAQFKANMRDYRERIDRYTLSLHNHGMAATQSDIEWIDELISNERALGAGPLGGGGTS